MRGLSCDYSVSYNIWTLCISLLPSYILPLSPLHSYRLPSNPAYRTKNKETMQWQCWQIFSPNYSNSSDYNGVINISISSHFYPIQHPTPPYLCITNFDWAASDIFQDFLTLLIYSSHKSYRDL